MGSANEHLVDRHSPVPGDDVGDRVSDVLRSWRLDRPDLALGRLADVLAEMLHEFRVDGAGLDNAHSGALLDELLSERLRECIKVQVVCPAWWPPSSHPPRDLSAVPRMSAEDVVTASLRGLELGEVVCAPGVERAGLLQAVFEADVAVFGAQSHELATRHRPA